MQGFHGDALNFISFRGTGDCAPLSSIEEMEKRKQNQRQRDLLAVWVVFTVL